MHTQQILAASLEMNTKIEERIIDPSKIKSLLSKKLSTSQLTNPQEILNSIDEQIQSKVQKTQAFILKNQQRQNKIKTVQTRQLQSRSLLQEKLNLKMKTSIKKKITQDNQKLKSIISARKLKEQLFTARKKQIQETQFRKRLEKFKQIKAENQANLQNQTNQLQPNEKNTTLKRSFSVQNSFSNTLQKRNEIEQIQYFKKLQSLQKRKIYQKPHKPISIPERVDKTQWIQKLNQQTQHKYIQKIGLDLWKIQQARLKKEKSINQKIDKLKKGSEFKQQQRGYKLENLKQDINAKIKNHRQVLNKKNERFLTMRNKSTPNLQRNLSNISQNRDTFEMSTKRGFLDSTNKMLRTLQNFKQLKHQSELKAFSYYEKQKQSKLKKEALNQLEEILRKQRVEKLIK